MGGIGLPAQKRRAGSVRRGRHVGWAQRRENAPRCGAQGPALRRRELQRPGWGGADPAPSSGCASRAELGAGAAGAMGYQGQQRSVPPQVKTPAPGSSSRQSSLGSFLLQPFWGLGLTPQKVIQEGKKCSNQTFFRLDKHFLKCNVFSFAESALWALTDQALGVPPAALLTEVCCTGGRVIRHSHYCVIVMGIA